MYIDTEEFIDEGYLQEVNRKFFHPLGLCLTVGADTDDETGERIGPWFVRGVADHRDDIEGMVFNEIDTEKAAKVQQEVDARRGPRTRALGYWVQPVLEAEDE